MAKVINLKEQGLNNTEIARQLSLSRQTVSKYVNQNN
ncbi:LuxR C-terminal-related transcriptional regulator [Sporanaerobacter sp.]